MAPDYGSDPVTRTNPGIVSRMAPMDVGTTVWKVSETWIDSRRDSFCLGPWELDDENGYQSCVEEANNEPS
jgi:hypothetical protein